MRRDEIIWAYKKRTKHSVNFIPTGSSYSLVVRDARDKLLELSNSEQLVNSYLARSLCWSVQIVTLTTSQRMLESAPARSRYALGPGEAVFGEREGADAFAGDDEDSVADGGENRRKGGFAEAGG